MKMKTQSILKTALCAAGFSAFAFIGSAQAQILLTGGDSTDGWVAPANPVLAYNFNDGGGQSSGDALDSLDQVIQGVTFTSWSSASTTAPTVAAGVTTTTNRTGGSFYFNAPIGFGASTNDAAMAALVKTIIYNTSGTLSFSLTGLTAGTYTLDEFVMSGGEGARPAQTYSVNGGLGAQTVTFDEAADTAYVVENTVVVTGAGNLTFSDSGSVTPEFGGFALSFESTPEPSTFALIGLGGLALLIARRRFAL